MFLYEMMFLFKCDYMRGNTRQVKVEKPLRPIPQIYADNLKKGEGTNRGIRLIVASRRDTPPELLATLLNDDREIRLAAVRTLADIHRENPKDAFVTGTLVSHQQIETDPEIFRIIRSAMD